MPLEVTAVSAADMTGRAWHPRLPAYRVAVHLLLEGRIVGSTVTGTAGHTADGFGFDLAAWHDQPVLRAQLCLAVAETGERTRVRLPTRRKPGAPVSIEEIMYETTGGGATTDRTFEDALSAGASTRAVIEGFYLDLFRRVGSAAEIDAYVGPVESGAMPLDTVREQMIGSAEFGLRRNGGGRLPGSLFAAGIFWRTMDISGTGAEPPSPLAEVAHMSAERMPDATETARQVWRLRGKLARLDRGTDPDPRESERMRALLEELEIDRSAASQSASVGPRTLTAEESGFLVIPPNGPEPEGATDGRVGAGPVAADEAILVARLGRDATGRLRLESKVPIAGGAPPTGCLVPLEMVADVLARKYAGGEAAWRSAAERSEQTTSLQSHVFQAMGRATALLAPLHEADLARLARADLVDCRRLPAHGTAGLGMEAGRFWTLRGQGPGSTREIRVVVYRAPGDEAPRGFEWLTGFAGVVTCGEGERQGILRANPLARIALDWTGLQQELRELQVHAVPLVDTLARLIDELREAETELAGASPQQRHAERRQMSIPLLGRIRERFRMLLVQRPMPEPVLALARYGLARWHELAGFIEDGRIPFGAAPPFSVKMPARIVNVTQGGNHRCALFATLLLQAKGQPAAHLTTLLTHAIQQQEEA